MSFTVWLRQASRARAIDADLESIWIAVEKNAAKIIVALAIAVAIVTSVFSTRSAAGADASGYLSEAAAMTQGRLFHVDDLAGLAPGQDPFLTSPLGWRPSPRPGLQSPTYPPGLPVLMAIPHLLAGATGATAVVIAAAAIVVMATAFVAMRLSGGIAAVLAAALIGFAPITLYQAIQPMSDVPVTAAWMLCFFFLCRDELLRGDEVVRGNEPSGSFSGGIACAVAVLIRPNLAPLAIVPLFLARNRIVFSIPVAIAGIALAILQWLLYGSPLRSGYGSAEELFALANVGANASRYVTWLMTTSPVLLLALVGFWRLRRDRATRSLVAFAILVIAAYLAYAVFDDWSYLRFLLPALAVFAIFASVALAAALDRVRVALRPALAFAIMLVIVASGIAVARSKDTFRLSAQLRRVGQVADFVRGQAEPNAVIVAGEQSGSMRYYTGKSILRWEAASADAMGVAVRELDRTSRPIYIVLDAWEESLFRAKYAFTPSVALDWPPVLEAGSSNRTRVWRLSDRERFHRGEKLNTIRLP
jgi:4-amino-4-deoxy-L-arabinose transferase-like glycosyltransferase